jgi:hypothetical protein
MKRTVIAFLVAPLVPTLAFAHDAGFTGSFIWSYLCSYIFGIPVFLVLRKRKKESHLIYAMFGLALGALYIVAINLSDLHAETLALAAIFGVVGAVTALCFSLIRGHETKRA